MERMDVVPLHPMASPTKGSGIDDSASAEPCAGCQRTGLSLLACDDPEATPLPTNEKLRFCAECMIGKQVRVFWPIDSSWYAGTVQQYDPSTGEHLLKYDDDDTEWVKIGESGQSTAPVRSTASPPDGGEQMDTSPNRGQGDLVINRGVSPADMEQRIPSFSSEPPQGGSPDQRWAQSGGHPGGARMGMPPQGYPPYGGPTGGPPPQGMYGHHGPPGYGMPPGGMHPGTYAMPGYPGQPGAHSGGPPSYGFPPMMGMPGGPPGACVKRGAEHSGSLSPSGGSKRKSGPKAWTKEEDAMLLALVQNMRMPMKWSIVAQSMPDRTGKQCRERYVNHLNPRLKVSDWSPVEDATIFQLYNTMGSHWAKMSKMIPGRTDNGIKNRFHNLRRQLEREDEHRLRLSKAPDFPNEIRLDRLREFPSKMKGRSDELWNMQRGIGILAAQSVLGGGIARNAGRFGPFRASKSDETCVRCGFFVPSAQCGNEICCKTGWCQSCTRIPPHVSGALLRECLNLRRCQDADQRGCVEEKFQELFLPDKPPQKADLMEQGQE